MDDEVIELRRHLGRGAVGDVTFDELYPAQVRAKSARFWTPVSVAYRAAQMFASQNVGRVLDVGAGVGKFCLVAACARPDIDFTGIEQRPHLVEVARRAAMLLATRNVRFLTGDATGARFCEFDGLYLFNPFAENIHGADLWLDHTVDLSVKRFTADVQRVVVALVAARVGTCLVTYHGFGGLIPASYDLVRAERTRFDWLRLWVKRRQMTEVGAYHLEGSDGVTLVHVVDDAL